MTSRFDRWFADRYDRLTEPVEREWLGALRDDLLRDLSGDVLEIGPGTGANRDHYPADLRSLTLAEPAPAMRAHLERRYEGFRPMPRVLTCGAESLDGVGDASVDAVVGTLVLCSVADPAAALGEIRRVLRPGGRFVTVEHVRGTGAHAVLQRVVTPLTVRLAAGCRHDRDTLALARDAGFDVSQVRDTGRTIAGFTRPVVAGVAVARD